MEPKGSYDLQCVRALEHMQEKTMAMFSSQKILQNFSDSPSHRIFRHIHEALNIDEK
jgi:hypothetical protein